ncbi:translation termination inhibitor protein itt1 [Arthrobotrys musiformis]|uniref:RBR-type E3 ubiquitin transferase n=1 Tax=Arthrobotrys musiformis TaxID=47236 RepID=A0AAV9W7D2_9PEZI
MSSKSKGKQRADNRHLPTPALVRRPTDASDILSSKLTTLALEPSENISPDDERILEIATIAVIYPEFSKIGKLGGSIDIEISPSSPVTTKFTLLDGAEDVKREETADISHLPPLVFEFQLPEGYPYSKPPNIRLVSSWLDTDVLGKLKAELLETWEGLRDQAIFAYIDTLQSAADRMFDLPVPLDVRVNQKEKIEILEFDQATKIKKFNEGTFDCGICLEPKKGATCHRINQCGHVFCKPCLKDYFTAMITEGDVGSVQCLNYLCGKDLPPEEVTDEEGKVHAIPRKPGAIAPAELQLLLEADIVERYLRLKRKRAFESMKNVVYCPRNFCKGPALRDNAEDKLAICQDCSLAFCADCGKSWHGYTFSCRLPGSSVQMTEAEAKEAKLTAEFLESNCTPCPTCLIPISKSGGCNHMFCSRCWTHFCLLCGAFLFPDNPYQHYNQPKSSCYNRLWEGVDESGEILEVHPPPPPEEPPQPMMIQIVVPGQAPREVNLPPEPAPVAEQPIAAEPLNNGEPAGPATETNDPAEGPADTQENEEADSDDENFGVLTPLDPEDESDFWIIYSRNECFSEGYLMLEEGLTLTEIADFLRDWAASINQHRKNKMGLGTYWRRLIEWRRKVRDPRLKNKNIDLGEYTFSDEAIRVARMTGRTEEAELIRRWWEIWNGGMSNIAANSEWDEDEVRIEEEARAIF